MRRESFLRLQTKRAVNERTGILLTHTASRHVDQGNDRLHYPWGKTFKQGSLFPANVSAGVVTRLERIVQQEYEKMRRGHPSRIISSQNAGEAERVTVTVRTHGVKQVGAFIRGGVVATVFPEQTRSSNFIVHKGVKTRKA